MDDATGGVTPRCPWCSAELTPKASSCPSCGATLTAEAEPQIPGVTTVAGATASRFPKPPRPNRLMRWISGEPGDADDGEPAGPASSAGSLEPPPTDVRREIRRLEIEAQLTNLTAEASAIAADDALQASAANDEAAADTALRVARDARAVAEAIDRAEPPADGDGIDGVENSPGD